LPFLGFYAYFNLLILIAQISFMKKRSTLLFLSLFTVGSLFAQFTDNFDSYTAGGYLGIQSGPWTTWSGAQGGAEDVQITTADANSAPNSVLFTSTAAAGGPQDVVLPFGGVRTTGQFSIGMAIKVQTNKGAYFNLQADATIGQTWALECQMLQNGNMTFGNTNGQLLATTYTPNTWFDIRIDIDLNANNWEVFINNVSQGSFSNPINRVSFLNIYPVNQTAAGGNGQSGFYVDDVFYTHTPYTLPAVNGAVTLVSVPSGLATQQRNVSASIRNLGTTTITSFDINYNYNGNNSNQSVTGLNLASLATYQYTFPTQITLVAGSNPVTVTISNVNGAGADGDANDNVKVLTINPVVPAAGKMVVGEEGTGTWCGWCPRGAVFMDMMASKYDGFWAGIAVHNGDPMVVSDYDAAIGGLIGGYPSALVDRGTDIDPSQMEAAFLSRVVLAPAATFAMNGSFNSSNSQLTVNVTTTFQTATSGDWRILMVLTEDDVTGTGSGYNQTNYYAGGSNGVMGGYEALANPVPAAQMHYEHVARDIEPSFTGIQNAFTASIAQNDAFNNTFNFTINAAWELNHMHAIVILRHPNGSIENAGMLDLSSLVTGVDDNASSVNARLYPNPAADLSQVEINLDVNSTVSMEVYDLQGKVIATRDYGVLNGKQLLPIHTSAWEQGVYLVRLTVNGEVKSFRLIVQ